jgi:hypothetical protein
VMNEHGNLLFVLDGTISIYNTRIAATGKIANPAIGGRDAERSFQLPARAAARDLPLRGGFPAATEQSYLIYRAKKGLKRLMI